MGNRIKIVKNPAVYKAMMALESYVQATEITPLHQELIKIRASQINGCAYCLDMHTKDARKAGETEQRIYTLSAWRETPFFDEKEQAILALTEEVTLISKGGVSNETYDKAIAVLGDAYFTQVYMAIIAINGWNRIAIGTKMEPGM
ncbi:carboxymuconolactone decarboxylase family protein [Inquilinus sp. KBS0705]|nr:carboxymuconolactone decarboxylase family protein [Inquilinus sp. KBS0705]